VFFWRDDAHVAWVSLRLFHH